MAESTGKSRRFSLFPKRRDEDAPAPVPVPEFDENESVTPGVRLAAAWSWRLLLVGALIAVVIFLVIQLRLIVIPVLIAVLLSALLVPFSNFLQRHGWPKGLAVAAALLSAIVVVSGLVVLVVFQIRSGLPALQEQSMQAYEEFRDWLLNGPLQISDDQFQSYLDQAWAAIQQDSQVLVSGALSFGSTLGHVLTGLLLVLFSTLFMLIDGKGIWAWIVRVFPRRARAAVDGAGKAGWTTLGNFVKVQILVASIDAVGIGVGAALLGVPLALPIGVLVFLGSFIPIVGAVVTGAVAVIIALVFNGWIIALVMLGIVLLVQQVEGHVLQPLIMGSAVKVHPLAVVLVVAAGTLLAGIPGALFAVPFAAVLNVIVHYISSGAWRSAAPPADVAVSPLWQTVPRNLGQRRSVRQVRPVPPAPAAGSTAQTNPARESTTDD
ncbi:AI-2E family transporter [Compostimonas suwonensis]|uniref:Putative PurR-regulated permease PerM n=1 Tax=Compostimonas suwonensis TaxID=1048394 RepID=A0A2M9BW72_9MICO|nr:AI-2E family transporter [Compostimonas suwonensis]PJJ62207.1 putative PurR-regulated permease PerM [Compostimonas suwonensis]